jgi:hypothetical protein
MKINDVEPEHLGGGIVLFRKAIDLDWNYILNQSSNMIEKELSEMYKPGVDPETGEDVYVNKSGYLFSKDSINQMPKRAGTIHQTDNELFSSYLNFLEESRDYYLLKYMENFPLVYKCIWWKVKGHILEYNKGVYLGSHSDISADYIYGIDHPSDQLALRNVVTCLMYFNSCNSEEENSYTGGEHYFNYLDIKYEPTEGDIMFFPSNYMAAHEVLPVHSGKRYSYLGWYSQGTPNEKVHEYVVDPNSDPELSKKATNVYMPNLRSDFQSYLKEKGYSENSVEYSITKSNY